MNNEQLARAKAELLIVEHRLGNPVTIQEFESVFKKMIAQKRIYCNNKTVVSIRMITEPWMTDVPGLHVKTGTTCVVDYMTTDSKADMAAVFTYYESMYAIKTLMFQRPFKNKSGTVTYDYQQFKKKYLKYGTDSN